MAHRFSWGGTNTKLLSSLDLRVRIQLLVKQSRLCVSKQPIAFPETCKLQTVSSLPLANTNLMYIFGPRHLASQTPFSAIDSDIVVWPRTVDGGACGPRAVVADEVVWDFARCRVHAPGECAWAGVTGGDTQIKHFGCRFCAASSRFLRPDFRLPTRRAPCCSGSARSRLVRCPSLTGVASHLGVSPPSA